MTDYLSNAEARVALHDVERARQRVIDQIGMPKWYWWGLAACWIALGVPANDQYGIRGISSGRMPHFSRQLTDEQITAIVEYERSL